MIVCKYCKQPLDWDTTKYPQLRKQLRGVFRCMAFCSNEECPVKPMTNEFTHFTALLESEELKAISEECID